jgi:hypothetical protein
VTELRKHGNKGNKFPEPMSVFRNQVIRRGHNIQESVKLLSNDSGRKASEVNYEGISLMF